MKVYVAGPLGFCESGKAFLDRIIAVLRKQRHEVFNPWELTDAGKIKAVLDMEYGPERRDRWKELNIEIGGNNAAVIDSCDIVFAVLDGPDVDSGTAAEIGYAFAKGKTVIGYRNDFRLACDNEGSVVNLQVEYFIYKSGGKIIRAISELESSGL